MANRYMEDLREKLNKTRAPVTVGAYLRRLKLLNDDKPFQSMKFLMDYDAITKKIDEMKLSFNTKTSYITAICAILSIHPKYHALYKKYQTLMISNANKIKEEYAKNERNDKQKESIIPLDDVLVVREELRKEFENTTTMSKSAWERYVGYVLLCLYTMTPPRRNKDYAMMYCCLEEPETIDENKNYYVSADRLFIFNNYKTKSCYGQQRISVSDDLVEVLNEYIQLNKSSTQDEFPLLVDVKGERLNEINGITRILNRVMGGKKIGSSALRHIYLSDKFGGELEERKATATAMGHSLATATEYIKTK